MELLDHVRERAAGILPHLRLPALEPPRDLPAQYLAVRLSPLSRRACQVDYRQSLFVHHPHSVAPSGRPAIEIWYRCD